MGNKSKPYRTKAVSIERRLIEQRSKIFRALLNAENKLDPTESLVLLTALIETYIDLVRLKMAYQVSDKTHD